MGAAGQGALLLLPPHPGTLQDGLCGIRPVSAGDQAAAGCYQFVSTCISRMLFSIPACPSYPRHFLGATWVTSLWMHSTEHIFGTVLLHGWGVQPISSPDSHNKSQGVVTPIRSILGAVF